MIMLQTPPAMIVVCPAAVNSGSGPPLGLPARDAELGSVLGALRDTAAPLAPAPGVARLDELAARARSAGFAVSVAAEGAARPLPAGVGAAAYRIVQEALTNAVRHSGGRAASVLLRYSGDDLVIEVSDDGGGAGAGGGFLVLARLPG
jgi:signal transduction histidine kinase